MRQSELTKDEAMRLVKLIGQRSQQLRRDNQMPHFNDEEKAEFQKENEALVGLQVKLSKIYLV